MADMYQIKTTVMKMVDVTIDFHDEGDGALIVVDDGAFLPARASATHVTSADTGAFLGWAYDGKIYTSKDTLAEAVRESVLSRIHFAK